jgi:hypothetical protein
VPEYAARTIVDGGHRALPDGVPPRALPGGKAL